MKRAMGSKRKISTIIAVAVSCSSMWSIIGVQAFRPSQASTRSPRSPANLLQSPRPNRLTIRSLSNNNDNNNDNNNNDNNNNDDDGPFDFDLLPRRFERADKIEIRNDATLVACYVLCRFLIFDIASGAKIEPGWEIQDWIWLTGTFSSATVLVVYYAIAGLLSRSYERNSSFAAFGPSPIVRALVNVALCCPVWLATEHFLGFGPPNIGGDTLGVAVGTGFAGFGSFMALAKILTAETVDSD